MSCYSCEHADTNVPSFIFETPFWSVYLNSEQSYLGRSVVVLKAHKPSLSDLSNEEWKDMQLVIKRMEHAVKTGLGAILCNWTCLMNDAYQEANPEPHVHWHLRPRYNKSVTVAEKLYNDPDFGHHYNQDRKQEVGEEVIKSIVDLIKVNLPNQ